jgi:hypothetical protein
MVHSRREDHVSVRVLDKGRYELFKTNHRHRILVLGGRKWYALVRGQQGQLIVRTSSDHVKSETLQRGRYYYVDFRRDPTFEDQPHLFLQKDERFREIILPDGFPTRTDPQKRVVLTRKSIAAEELERYLRHPAPPGPGDARRRTRTRARRTARKVVA